ncbi:GNAT family N-acetyltransferase [Arenibaculum sp.]|uniref:GNAT family N-acetyltransferase n=1 Tax=Arenibaculum sp. TaxID=2865862 RepID=UPI002E11BA02|nr:GNAT family N-acetyltransferase [Arenibaculum sp.]
MRVELREDAGGLEEEWWELWRRSAAGPFQSPAWLLAWRECFADGRAAVLTLRASGRLVGLLPLFELDGRLLAWGAGTSDYLDGVFAPGLDPVPLGHALGHVLGRALDGLPLDLFQVPPGSPLLAMPAPEGWPDAAGEGEPCPEVALPARLSRSMAQNLRTARNRAERAGGLEAAAGGPELLDALFALHGARWREHGGGVLSDARVADFHRAAVPALAASGLLRLYRIAVGGRTAAVLYGLCAKGRFHYYIGGFDPEMAPIGPGTIAVGHAIDAATAEGAAHFDFLRGREPYKYRWGAVDRPTGTRRIAPPPTVR